MARDAARWFLLVALASGCTKSGAPELLPSPEEAAASRGPMASDEPPLIATRCGELAPVVDVAGCDPSAPDSPCATPEAALQWLLDRPDAAPTSTRGWAELIGALDGATAVFESEFVLGYCVVGGLPDEIGWRAGPLGIHSTDGRTTHVFVERLEPDPGLTMLVIVYVTFGQGVARISRRELWTMEPRIDACPSVAFDPLTPAFDDGDMFMRITAELAAMPEEIRWSTPTEIALVRDHLGVPGVRLVVARDHDGCGVGWSQTHCLVTAREVYCPGDAQATLARFVRDQRLGPHDLDRRAWLELVTVLLGVERVVQRPEELATCTDASDPRASAPAVEIADTRVRVELTALGDAGIVLHTVEIFADGRVTTQEET